MSGFCEGCPVPVILANTARQESLNPYWARPEVRLAIENLVTELFEISDCTAGPETEGLGFDTTDILISCKHPEADIVSNIGDDLDIIGDYEGVTPTVLLRTGTPDELENLSRQE